MKAFKFSLESVHRLRESRRSEAERRLGLAAAVILAETAAIEELERVRAVVEAKLSVATGPLNTAEVSLHVEFLAQLAEREAGARQRLASLERERETLRQHALSAAREAKVTGQLRSGQEARHTAEVARAEQNRLDEIAVIAKLRKGQNGDV
ncbi:MAG: flagellar export protein FliJ [Blastocatellia bacterium]|nr:flagellar export protein FliJ [Blastocatellia bacterium]